MIEISNLSYAYKGCPVLDGVSFKVNNGRRYGIYGGSGSGKSTLLALLSGGLPTQSGSIRINGFDMRQEPVSARRCIGYLPQAIGFYRSMTPYELLDFIASARGVQENRRFLHVHETLEFTGMNELRNRPISRLSGAERRRLGVAQTLIGNPEILLLDSPTEGLSTTEARELRGLIREIAGSGKTVFLASSVPSEILELCEDIFLLEDGRLSAPAPAAELLQGVNLLLRVQGDRTGVQQTLAATGDILSCRPVADNQDELVFRLRAGRAGLCDAIAQALREAGFAVSEIIEEEPGEAERALRRSAAGTARSAFPAYNRREDAE